MGCLLVSRSMLVLIYLRSGAEMDGGCAGTLMWVDW